MGVLHPRTEKNANQSLNVWVRCPIAVAVAALMVGGAILHPSHFVSRTHRWLTGLTGVHHFWNGCFFMYRTVDARTRFVLAAVAEKNRS